MNESKPKRAFVIGMGEVGRRLAGALIGQRWDVRPVTRDSGWEDAVDPNDPALRLIAVREEALSEALDRLAVVGRDRLVLLQNGFLEAVHGDLGPVTRGLIYFTSKKEFFKVLCPSPFHGPAAPALVEALTAEGIPTESVTDRSLFLEAMIVKGIWNAVVGLPLAVHGVDLAAYRSGHSDELEALVAESARAAGAEYAVEVDRAAALHKILDTTTDLGWVRGGAKALEWRNGAIARFGRRHGVPTPVNDRLLAAVGFDPPS